MAIWGDIWGFFLIFFNLKHTHLPARQHPSRGMGQCRSLGDFPLPTSLQGRSEDGGVAREDSAVPWPQGAARC